MNNERIHQLLFFLHFRRHKHRRVSAKSTARKLIGFVALEAIVNVVKLGGRGSKKTDLLIEGAPVVSCEKGPRVFLLEMFVSGG